MADGDLAADPGAEEEPANPQDESAQQVEADQTLPEAPVLRLERLLSSLRSS